MHTEKYKIWDAQMKEWFRPVYPGIKYDKVKKPYNATDLKEILFTQSGEMVMHTATDEADMTTHKFVVINAIADDVVDFIPCMYSGVKDSNDKKAYEKDTIKCDDREGVIIYNCGCFMIQWTDDRIEPLCLSASGRRRPFEITGNILEHKARLEAAANQTN